MDTYESLIIAILIAYIVLMPAQISGQISSILQNIYGRCVVLFGIYLVSTISIRIALFIVLAYIVTRSISIEHLDPTQQTPKKDELNVSELKGILSELTKSSDKLFKGDTRLPQQTQSKGEAPKELPKSTTTVEPVPSKKVEHFRPY